VSVTHLDTPTSVPAAAEDERDHWTCCEDRCLALCGLRDPDFEDDPEMEEASCVVCETLVDTHHCPRTNALTCLYPVEDN
jgi:hypothetical protein